MRNLKRALSLVMAAAMLIGMMVVGASAVSYADFTDKAEIKNVEAVDVMVALGVINGKGNGSNFDPSGTLTRAEAAKIICYMLMGPANAEKLGTTGATFTDVPASHWAAPYIGYCASLGILSGTGDGKFNPEGKLDGISFGKMLLTALGYDAKIEGYTNNKDWSTNIAVDMVAAGISVDGIVLSDPISRDNACQMAFQALTANMVRYSSKGTEITTSDGTTVVIGASDPLTYGGALDYTDATTTDGKESTTQFCEQYFPKLRMGFGVQDDFGRAAAYSWYLDKDGSENYNPVSDVLVFNASKTPLITYTATTLNTQIAKDLKGYTFTFIDASDDPVGIKLVDATTAPTGIGSDPGDGDTGDLTLVDGTAIATSLAALTGNGTVVEIYVDNTGVVENVLAITSTVETISNITTAANGDVTYDFSVSPDKIDYADDTVNADTVKLYGTFAKGDVVTTVQGTDYLHVYPTTKVVGAQSANNTTTNTITVGGTVYGVATGVTTDGASTYVATTSFSNSATEANYYLDQYGYVVKTDAINTNYTNYAQVKGETSRLDVTVDGATPVVEARFLLADGTVATYKVKVDYTAATGTYSLVGTEIYASGDTESDVQSDVSSVLAANTVFAYSLTDNTISLQAVAASDAAALNAGDMVTNAPEAVIAAGATSTTVEKETSGSVTTLLDKDTIYVLYDATKKTATTYTGTLPTGASLVTANTAVIACANSASLATAKVVFGLASDVGAVATADYAYIDSTVYTTALQSDGTTNYRVYEGTKADGTKVSVYGDVSGNVISDGSTPIATGLVTWDSENKITGAYTTNVISAETYTVVGEQMINNSTNAVYNMTNAKVVYVDTTKTTVNGNSCVVVLEVVNGAATNNAAVIYVVG